MGDPEIEAMSAVATALADLDAVAQGRVLKWAGERFGVTLAGETHRMPDPGHGSNGDTASVHVPLDGAIDVDEAAVMAAVAEETGVSVEKLERVFHIDRGQVKLLGPSSRYGSTTTNQARAVAKIVTIVRKIGMGQLDTPFELLKEACESKHCYDSTNFASYHLGKLEGFIVKGDKKARRLEAKGGGISAFAGIIDSVLGES